MAQEAQGLEIHIPDTRTRRLEESKDEGLSSNLLEALQHQLQIFPEEQFQRRQLIYMTGYS